MSEPSSDPGLLLVVIAEIPAEGVERFVAHESEVLPLVEEHGGRMIERLRGADGTLEVHLLWFPGKAAHDAYLGDPRREHHRGLLQASGATVRVERVVRT